MPYCHNQDSELFLSFDNLSLLRSLLGQEESSRKNFCAGLSQDNGDKKDKLDFTQISSQRSIENQAYKTKLNLSEIIFMLGIFQGAIKIIKDKLDSIYKIFYIKDEVLNDQEKKDAQKVIQQQVLGINCIMDKTIFKDEKLFFCNFDLNITTSYDGNERYWLNFDPQEVFSQGIDFNPEDNIKTSINTLYTLKNLIKNVEDLHLKVKSDEENLVRSFDSLLRESKNESFSSLDELFDKENSVFMNTIKIKSQLINDTRCAYNSHLAASSSISLDLLP